MKKEAEVPLKNEIKPLEINQAMVAIELSKTDGPVLDFFDFFSGHVPVSAAYFIHVLPNFSLYNTTIEKETRSLLGDYELNEDVIQRMDNKIRSRVKKREDMYIEFDVKEGDPLEELLKDAEDVNADLIVIGQKSGAEFHGILAKNLARRVKANALVVPDRSREQISRILIPIDFSENSVRALQMAVALNKQLDQPAEMICLNIYEMPNLSVYKIGKTRDQLKSMIEADRTDAFDAFLNTYVPDDVDQMKTVLIERDLPGVGRYIMNYAGEEDVDLIVMGAKGHSKVELLLMGSITEKILSLNDQIPVLIVK